MATYRFRLTPWTLRKLSNMNGGPLKCDAANCGKLFTDTQDIVSHRSGPTLGRRHFCLRCARRLHII